MQCKKKKKIIRVKPKHLSTNKKKNNYFCHLFFEKIKNIHMKKLLPHMEDLKRNKLHFMFIHYSLCEKGIWVCLCL